MDGFEKQLERIASKAALLAFVNALPDNVRLVLVCEQPDDPLTDGRPSLLDASVREDADCFIRFRSYGDVTIAQAAFLFQSGIFYMHGMHNR